MAKGLPKAQLPSLEEVDMSGLSEWEKSSITSVMAKAKEMQRKEDDVKFRYKMEGQLSKWTNLMKGWQYRWFLLNAESGMLEYYVDKGKLIQGSEPRGSVHLMGAVIAPSDEDSVTFSVNAANGDLFKLRACDARERQQWINKIRMVSEMHSSQLVNKVSYTNPNLANLSSTAVATKMNLSTSGALINNVGGGDLVNNEDNLSKISMSVISPEVIEYMVVIKELLNTTEAQQMAFMCKLEDSPSDGESVNPLSEEVLITKATAQATLHCLYQCMTILQKQIDDAQNVARNSGIPDDATIEWFGPTERKAVPHSQHAHMLHMHSVPTRPGSNKRSVLSCCQEHFHNIDDADSKPSDEVEDENEDDNEYTLESENIEEHKSLILHLLSKLKLGMDLTKVALPTFILEPRSSLEMFADFYGYPDLFVKISEQQTPEERMLAVVEYYLTSFYASRKDKYSKKPYNAIVGEIFRCSWDVSTLQTQADVSETETTSETDDCCRLHYIGEQVSHHPPVSAFYAECPEKNICMNCHIWTKSKFYGMSIGVELIGDGVLTLLNHDEEYILTFPNAYCRSILTHPWTELGGKVNISCSKTGYSSSITFHTKPLYGGLRDKITGEVKHLPSGRVLYRINGEWTDKIEISFPEKPDHKPKIIKPNSITKSRKKLRPLELQQENESRKLWHDVTEAVIKDDIDKAAEGKTKLEEAQREEAKKREEMGIEWESKLFHRHGEKWLYNSHLCLRRKRIHSASMKEKPKTT